MTAKKSADWISATLPAPPISNTNLPAGFSAEKIARSVARRVVGERRIQWRAAFETLGMGYCQWEDRETAIQFSEASNQDSM